MNLFDNNQTPSSPSTPDPFGDQGQGEQPPDDSTNDLFTYGPQYNPLEPDLKTGLRYTHSVNQPAPGDLFEPTQVNYDPMRNALDMGEQRMQQANMELNQQAQERFERAKFRTLWNIMGPETFNLISGAGVDTGTEEALRLQMQAEQDANRIDQQTTQQQAEQEIQNAYQRAQMMMEERQQNEQAERQSQVQQYEAEQQRRQNIAGAAANAFSTQAERDMAQQQAEADRRNQASIAAQDRQLEYMNMERDLLSDLGDDPQVLPMLGRVRQMQYPDASPQQIQASLGRDYIAAMLSNPDRMAPRGAGGSGDAGPWSAITQSQGALTQAYSLINSMGEDESWRITPWDSRDDEYTAQGNRRSYTEDVRNLVPYVQDQLNHEINAVRRANRDRDTVPSEVLSDMQRAQEAIDALDEIEVQNLSDADQVKQIIAPLVRDSFLGSDPVPQIEGVGGRVQDIVIGTHQAIRSVDDPAIPAVAAYAGVPEEEIMRGYAALQNGGVGALSQHAQGVNQRQGQDAGQETAQPDINDRVDSLVGGVALEPEQEAYDAIEEFGFEGDVKTMTPTEYAALSESERNQLRREVEGRETLVVVDRGRGEPLRRDIAAYPEDLDRLAFEVRDEKRQDRLSRNLRSVSDAVQAPFEYVGRNLDRSSALSVLHSVTGDPIFDSNPYNTSGGRGDLSSLSRGDYQIEQGPTGPELIIHNPKVFGGRRTFRLESSTQAAKVDEAMQTLLDE